MSRIPTAPAALAQRIFDTRMWRPDQPLRVVLIGTDFEVRVWETLLKIPMGCAVSYSDIASKIENPKASRAVGAAVGKNPMSFVVPCHRALGKDGTLDRLSLGHHAQAGDARLGSRAVGGALDEQRVRSPSFRGDAKHRTRSLEIPVRNCAPEVWRWRTIPE